MSREVGKMVQSRKAKQVQWEVRTEGARRATGVRDNGASVGASLAP